MPAKPRPLSATTTTPPARHTAYTAAVRSADGSHEQGDPVAGPEPGGGQPGGELAHPAVQRRTS